MTDSFSYAVFDVKNPSAFYRSHISEFPFLISARSSPPNLIMSATAAHRFSGSFQIWTQQSCKLPGRPHSTLHREGGSSDECWVARSSATPCKLTSARISRSPSCQFPSPRVAVSALSQVAMCPKVLCVAGRSSESIRACTSL